MPLLSNADLLLVKSELLNATIGATVTPSAVSYVTNGAQGSHKDNAAKLNAPRAGAAFVQSVQSVKSTAVLQACLTDQAIFEALTQLQLARLSVLLSPGTVVDSPEVRAVLSGLFPGAPGATTRAALLNLVQKQGSILEKLLSRPGATIDATECRLALTL